MAVLAGALGDELFDPVAEALERRFDDQRQLVAAAAGQRTERRAEHDAGVAGVRRSTGRRHPCRLVQQRVEVEAEQGGGRQPDVGQRRIAPADVGRVEEHRAEGVAVRDRLDRVIGVAHGHEVIALVLVADVVVAGVLECPEVRQEGQRLGRRARLGGDDVAAGLGAEGRGRQRDRLGIGRVEDADRHGPVAHRVGQPEDLGRQRAAAHAADQGAVEAGLMEPVRERAEVVGHGAEVGRCVEPAEPGRDLGGDVDVVRPDLRVTLPDARRPAIVDGRAQGGVDRRPVIGGDPVALERWRVDHDGSSIQAVVSARSPDPSWPFDLPWSSGGGETTPRIVPVRTPRATWATAASVKPKASKMVAAGAEAP